MEGAKNCPMVTGSCIHISSYLTVYGKYGIQVSRKLGHCRSDAKDTEATLENTQAYPIGSIDQTLLAPSDDLRTVGDQRSVGDHHRQLQPRETHEVALVGVFQITLWPLRSPNIPTIHVRRRQEPRASGRHQLGDQQPRAIIPWQPQGIQVRLMGVLAR